VQPASTYMNAIRERISIIQRAGGRSARKGPSYINGAAYSPRVLIALMNIWRVHCNFFDWRTYEAPANLYQISEEIKVEESSESQMRQLSVPGTDKKIFVPVRRKTVARRTTPAMRMGVITPSQAGSVHTDTAAEDLATPPEAGSTSSKGKVDRRRDDRPYLPNLSRILYQPWLFHGTP
jgi:hypothetical protein